MWYLCKWSIDTHSYIYCTLHSTTFLVHEEKNSWFSDTANVKRKTVNSSGIWTRTFGKTGPPFYASVKSSREYLVQLNWIKWAHRSQWLDSSTGRAADRCSRRCEFKPARVNSFSVDVSSVRKSWNCLLMFFWGWFWYRIEVKEEHKHFICWWYNCLIYLSAEELKRSRIFRAVSLLIHQSCSACLQV